MVVLLLQEEGVDVEQGFSGDCLCCSTDVVDATFHANSPLVVPAEVFSTTHEFNTIAAYFPGMAATVQVGGWQWVPGPNGCPNRVPTAPLTSIVPTSPYQWADATVHFNHNIPVDKQI